MMSGISGMNGMAGGMRPDPQQMFNRLDRDGSTGLDKDELNTMAEKVAERTGNEIDVDSLMETYDGDGDGVLNEEEANNAMESLRDQMGPPPGEGPPPGGGRPEQADADTYGKDGVSAQNMINQLLESLSAAEDEDETDEITQQWIATLKGENTGYTPIDTVA